MHITCFMEPILHKLNFKHDMIVQFLSLLLTRMRISADLQSDNLFHSFGGLTNAPYEKLVFDQMVYDLYEGYEPKLNYSRVIALKNRKDIGLLNARHFQMMSMRLSSITGYIQTRMLPMPIMLVDLLLVIEMSKQMWLLLER